jgi:hypothetical protein
MDEELVKLLGNRSYVAGVVNEAGVKPHPPKHRKQQIHQCRRVGGVRYLASRSHGDGLKRRGLITAFVDDLARGAKNVRPCLGRVGADRAAWSPAG